MAYVYVRITENFECFQFFNFETSFLKNENLFQNLEYCFLVGITNIENSAFSYKTTLSVSSVMTNRMGSTKWAYQKERSFASNYFFLKKFRFSLRNCYKELIWGTAIQMSIFIVFLSAGVFFEGIFSFWVSFI